MKTIIPLLIVFFSCNYKEEVSIDYSNPTVFDNNELLELYNEDQMDRRSNDYNYDELIKRDKKRRIKVQELLDSNKLITSNDYQNAAMIFQHGEYPSSYKKAVELMEKSIQIDSTVDKWLLAAATDRYLLSMNEPQVYGTQFSQTGPWEKPWELSTIDTTIISDKQRVEYGVGTLKEIREIIARMNRKKLEDIEDELTINEIISLIITQTTENPEFDISEKAINNFGY